MTNQELQAVQALSDAAKAIALSKADALTMSEMFWNDIARVKNVRPAPGVMLSRDVMQAVVDSLQ